MRNYELMAIYKSELGDQPAMDLSKKVKELVASFDGKVTKADYWGKRKFAYEIKHAKEGYYDILYFELDPSNISKLKTKLNITTGLVRYLISARS